jgi:phosphoglycerol transferase
MFAVGILFTFLIATKFLNFYWSVFAASVTALSPIALQISFFMPETMYFMTMTIVIWTAIQIMDSTRWYLWSLLGGALGLAALVKPHAIFVLPAILFFIAIVDLRKNNQKVLTAIGSLVAAALGFLISKLSVGYLLAGTAGLNIFGGYGNPISVLTGIFSSDESNSPATETTPVTPEPAAGATESSSAIFLDVFPSHFVYHLGFMLLIAGVPLFLGLRLTAQAAFKGKILNSESGYLMLVFLIAAVLLVLVPAFEAYVTSSGDDHSNRLILRYYEFLIPQFIIAGLLLAKFTPPKLGYRIAQAGLIIAAGIWLAESYSRNFGWKFADSSTLPGIAKTSSFLLIAIFIGLAVAYWAEKPARGTKPLTIGTIPIVLALALFLAQNTLLDRRGDVSVIEEAGWGSKPYLAGVVGEEILIVGELRPNVFATKFWLDKPGIKDLLVVEGGTLGKDNLDDAQYVLFLGQFELAEPYTELVVGNGFKLLRVND